MRDLQLELEVNYMKILISDFEEGMEANYDLTISVFANKPLEIRDAQGTLLDQTELKELWRDFMKH